MINNILPSSLNPSNDGLIFMIQFNDNPILIDVNSRKRNKKQLFCVFCNNEKIQLECFNPEENRYSCPRCRILTNLGFEIFPQEDILESSHELEEEEQQVYYLQKMNFNQKK